eukprot:PhM_4_TR3537/c0_g3_i1/m.27788/K01626/E2.5.1.54, aroF, aroG, aroH; 3-deoxy-7-phosphoheptulonate synthase
MNDDLHQHIATTDDLNVRTMRPLMSPAVLLDMLPGNQQAYNLVARTRADVLACLDGRSDRLVVIVGPCSIHDPVAALEYGEGLARLSEVYHNELVIIMRCYFAKPRTTVGWKGYLNDPDLDGSYNVNEGLRGSRELILGLLERGVPVGTEFLDAISPQYMSDLISWGAIGARTSESQTHREMVSGMSMPVGFKNGTDGNVKIAVDAVEVASHPHHFLGITKQGQSAIVSTRGNDGCHVILRGASSGPNYDEENVKHVVGMLRCKGCHSPRVLVDFSHGNCQKDHDRQQVVCEDVARQVESASCEDGSVFGVMIESFLVAGNQSLDAALAACSTGSGKQQQQVGGSRQVLLRLTYGQSITDPCVDMATTAKMLERLAEAVRRRRAH